MLVRRKNKSCVLIPLFRFHFHKIKIPRMAGDFKIVVHNRYRMAGLVGELPDPLP
jgi:hypothetical protein